ncbi:lens fiber membrane intrinsic protein-like isoform X1 [Podarcis raffonei]|uniref:lens fiber membrane intrinsic protein-like isoform X1 n=2 Tax=Podarcis raffonei TaxID=65483 RepID=UPI0023299F51|nr:lens fiber membrane intrinsic protein-like isoform X1 [Podarcis raffonei]
MILAKVRPMPFVRKTYSVMCCVNIVLLIICIASPNWLVHHCVKSNVHLGLWLFCFEKDCKPHPYSIESLEAVRGLMIIALIFTCFALLCGQNLLSRITKREILDCLISSIANYCAGLCTVSSLMIVLFEVRVVIDADVIHLAPDWAFCIACVSFSLSLVLGTQNLLWDRKFHKKVKPSQEEEPSTPSDP